MKALVKIPNPTLFVNVLAVAVFLLGAGSARASGITELMPKVGDHTSMWWVDGFPGTVAGAPWHRCIQTGSYTMVLDTEKLTIPHLGVSPSGIEYGSLGEWPSGQSAKLTLAINVGGVRYVCVRGGEWSKTTGPRLVESGRFFRGVMLPILFLNPRTGTRSTWRRASKPWRGQSVWLSSLLSGWGERSQRRCEFP